MQVLNLDCWQLIFEQLEPETRTLYSCLFVSKSFFHLSTKVLYCRPLHLFNQQTEFSPFSVYRLANLMDLCSGFTTPVVAKPVTTAGSIQQKQQSRSTKIAEPLKVSQSSSRDFFYDTFSVKIRTEIQVNQPIVTFPTTINYFQLVEEYPRSVMSRYVKSNRFQDFLNCFAETIPILKIYIQDIETILPYVSRFRILHTMTIVITSLNQSFGSNYITKLVEFVQAHNQYFPGVLKELPQSGSWFDWKEYISVQEAMGGMTTQLISLKPLLSDQNLREMNVSRLKSLSLYCPRGNQASGKPMAEFLKSCTMLESLEMNWPMTAKLDWSLLLKDKVLDRNRIVVGGVGGSIVEETKERDGFGVFKIKTENPTSSTTLFGNRSLQQLEQPEPAFNLRHLIVEDNTLLMIQAMELFKNSLESIKLLLRYADVYGKRTLDWKSLFSMPKLKSIELNQFVLVPDNLSCCPVLETLTIKGDIRFFGPSPLNSTWPTIPVTLRKLYLSRFEMDGLDILMLKPLRNVEFLHLEPTHSSLPSTTPVDMSTGWYFPKLKHVALYGKFAFGFQGQILWIAPRLEYLKFDLWIREKSGVLDTNTFLFPPSELDFVKATPGIDGFTRLVPLTRVSTASFPVLKSLGLNSFKASNSTVQEFADLFFGPQLSSATIMVTETGNDSEKKHFERIDRKGGDHHSKDGARNRFLFPNLEQLEFFFDEGHNLFYSYFTPCVFKAMKFMPKLERISYPKNVQYWEYPWLKDVQGSRLAFHNIDYCNRFLAIKSSTTTTTTTAATTLSKFWKKQLQNHKTDCVIEFDNQNKHQCQLDEASVNFVNRTKRRSRQVLQSILRVL